MGQKVNPIGFRIGVYRDWATRWFARGNSYADMFFEDIRVKDYIKKHLSSAEISQIEIEKAGDSMRIIVHSARPGVVIGKKGQEIDMIRRDLATLLGKKSIEVSVQEVKRPELSAPLVAQAIAEQLEKRASFKKVMAREASSTMRAGGRGIYIRIAGRIGGAEIARCEWMRVGSIPRHTLRSDVDYGFAEARTTYGTIGVKVWICRGEYGTATV